MILSLLSKLILFALHVDNMGIFPKPLPPKDEKKYFELMAQGDKRAKDKLIEHNLRLVAHIVKKYNPTPQEQEELISIGTIGLIKGVTTFDYKKGAKFATYASRCIENEILMNFRSMKKSAGDVYINEPIESDKDGNTLTLIDLIDDGSDINEQIDLLIHSQQLRIFLDKCLSKRENEIIIMRYGLCGNKPHTQNEVAEKLKISRSYVSRIEKKALEKLKKAYDTTPF